MNVFCSKCHRLAATLVKDGDNTKVIQNGQTLLNIRGGTKMSNFSVNCPHGHSVRINI
jgi:hypothetical protein